LSKNYDLIVVGAGAAGMIAAIRAARNGKKVLLLEKLSQIAAKLRATGGGRLQTHSQMKSLWQNLEETVALCKMH
jgi:predicted flavoprotein YhiN